MFQWQVEKPINLLDTDDAADSFCPSFPALLLMLRLTSAGSVNLKVSVNFFQNIHCRSYKLNLNLSSLTGPLDRLLVELTGGLSMDFASVVFI